ncbi:hypothetical protein GUJ93_ZPchr0003g17664 [Zizania palustris]|uniref:Uncharacterized protein n=1 Tax=Zizania palustris TaxID=103762 RepID=A0A8J5RWZ6_ZIZPA|nr:hypothetical protein GUJ93_ZPchr0003g17664 [Zizania palustris]
MAGHKRRGPTRARGLWGSSQRSGEGAVDARPWGGGGTMPRGRQGSGRHEAVIQRVHEATGRRVGEELASVRLWFGGGVRPRGTGSRPLPWDSFRGTTSA